MLKRFAVVLGSTLLASFVSGPLAAQQLSPEWTSCIDRSKRSPDVRIRACTAVLQSSRESAGSRAIAFYHRGLAYFAKGDSDRAIADYGEAIRLVPSQVEVYSERALAYLSKQDDDRAIADYSEAIRLDPSHARAYRMRGVSYFSKGDYDRAIADYSDLIRLNPTGEAYRDRGRSYYAKGDYDRAIADYGEAIRLEFLGTHLQRPGPRVLRQGRLWPRHCRLQRGH